MAKEKARLAAEAQQREQALDPSASVEIEVKEGTCCCFGFKVEKEQARLALEAQALPIASYV